MITFEDAYTKAKSLKDNIDLCVEYENGFFFGSTEDEDYIGGAGHTPVIIQKKDGKAINMPQFVINGTGQEIREIVL